MAHTTKAREVQSRPARKREGREVGPIRLLRVADLHYASSEPFHNFALGGTGNMDLHIFLWIVIGSSVVYGIWEWLSEKARSL